MPQKSMKPLDARKQTYKQPLQHDVEKAQEKDKIKPQDIFEQMGGTNKKKNKKKKKY
jgi:hypothetical protein